MPCAQRATECVKGELDIHGETAPIFAMSVLGDGATKVTAKEDTQFALIGGANLGQRHIDWNFVSSRKERIEQAKEDWRAGRFPKVVGDEEEFIPLPG